MENVCLAISPKPYLDRRRREWQQYEEAGLIAYDSTLHAVRIETTLADVLEK